MGTVYKARDTLLDRVVALKVLDNNRLTDANSRARFEREGIIVSSLKNEHIVTFFNFGISEQDIPFIAMEYLTGETLRTVLDRESALDWKRALNIAVQICDALGYAHERGIIHRDLKPENIMLLKEIEGDSVKVLDFGLATVLPGTGAELQKLTATGKLMGTLKYMSPEQCTGKALDQRSDIYSLSCLIYETVMGEAPYQAASDFALVSQHTSGSPKPFSSFPNKSVPVELESVLLKGMAKDPAARYQSMFDLKGDLQNLIAGKFSLLPKAKASRSLKKPIILALLGALIIAAVISAATYFHSQRIEDPKPGHKITTIDQVHKLLKKNLRLPVITTTPQVLDECLAIPELGASEKGQLYFLHGKLASNPIYYIIAINFLREANPKSYPPAIYLESLDKAQTLTANNYLYKLTRDYADDFTERYTDAELRDKEAKNARHWQIFSKVKFERTNLLLGNVRYAAREMERLADDTRPILDVYESLIDIGNKDRAISVAQKHPHDGDFVIGICDHFRTRGMLDDYAKCLELTRKWGYKGNDSLHLQMATKAQALYWMEKGDYRKAADTITDYLDHHPGVLFSNKAGEAELRPFSLGILALCGETKQSASLLNSLLEKKASLNDAVLLERMKSVVEKAPPTAAEKLKYYVKFAQAKYYIYERLFYLGQIDREQLAKESEFSFAALNIKRKCMEELKMPYSELSICNELMKHAGSKKFVIEDDSDEAGLTYHQWAQLRRIELLVVLDRTSMARPELAALEKTKLNEKQQGKMVFPELIINKKSNTKPYLLSCMDPDSLRVMSEAYRRYMHADMSQKAVDKAMQILATSGHKPKASTILALKTEQAYVYLENGDEDAARKVLSNTEYRNVKFSSWEITNWRLLRLGQAMALAQMNTEAAELLKYLYHL